MTLPNSLSDRNAGDEGLRRRDEGTGRAARNRPAETLTLQVRVLERALAGGEFTVDDISLPDEIANPFPGRGPFRGAALLILAKKKLIAKTGERRKTLRPCRHAGSNPVWRAAAERSALEAELAEVREELARLPQTDDYDGYDYCV